MASPFIPHSHNLLVYSGDGVTLVLTATNGDGGPLTLDGTVEAQIRRKRTDTDQSTEFAVDVDGNAVTLSLTGEQTGTLGKFSGEWDCQWTPPDAEPRTLVQGRIDVTLDVTR